MNAIATVENQEVQTYGAPISAETMQAILVDGDLEKLNPAQRLSYYSMRCTAAGLDPRSQPFQFVRLSGKLVLYARAAATQQLVGKNKISVHITGKTVSADGIIEYQVRASLPSGQSTDEVGVVSSKGKQGEELANCHMKALTKAKRRGVLAICGLEVLDETDLPEGAQPISVDLNAPAAKAIPPYMDADKASRLRAICTANKIPTEVVKAQIMAATGGRVVEKGPQNIPLYSQSEYETLVAYLKSWKAPAESQGEVIDAQEVMDHAG